MCDTIKSENELFEQKNVFDSHQKELKAIRDRLELLESTKKNIKKPWYKSASTIIALFAVVVSAVSIYLTLKEARRDQLREDKLFIGSILEKLLDLREENISIKNSDISEDEKIFKTSSLALKQQYYLEVAFVKLKTIQSDLSPTIYRVLSQEYTGFDNSIAFDYAKKAINSSVTGIQKVDSLLHMAKLMYYSKNDKYINEGRKQIQKAIKIACGPPGVPKKEIKRIFTLWKVMEEKVSSDYEVGEIIDCKSLKNIN